MNTYLVFLAGLRLLCYLFFFLSNSLIFGQKCHRKMDDSYQMDRLVL